MSLSTEERNANLYYALDLFTKVVGDRWIESVLIDQGNTEYQAIHNTTWDELQQKGLIESKSNGYYYLLTGLGWRVGLERLGKKDSDEFRQLMGKLAAVLKDSVKGREAPSFLFVQQVAQESGLPEGLICNIIDGQLFEWWLGKHGAEWEAYDGKGHLIKVPIRFNLELI